MKTHDPIGELKIKPHEQSRFLLGSYKDGVSPKGFSLRITPESELDSVTSNVISLDKRGGVRNLIMNIENFGTKTIKAQIWSL